MFHWLSTLFSKGDPVANHGDDRFSVAAPCSIPPFQHSATTHFNDSRQCTDSTDERYVDVHGDLHSILTSDLTVSEILRVFQESPSIPAIARVSKELAPSNTETRLCVLYYGLGYEKAVCDYDLERLRLEEEKRRNQAEYRQMCDLFSSYVEKASLELKRIRGDDLCDVAAMRREVRELRDSLTLLKCTFASFSQSMQSCMEELNSVLKKSAD